MSIPKTGSRLLRLNGSVYRWRVRGRPTYCQEMGWSNLILAVEAAHHKNGSVMVVYLDTPHPKNVMRPGYRAITPAEVSRWIQRALTMGWQPKVLGKPFGVSANDK